MSITLTIEGLDQFKADVQKGADNIQPEIQTAMVNSVNQVKNEAQNIAPYQTGTLRRSIYTDIQDNGFTGIVGQDSNIAPYGIDVEYGTAPHEIYPVNKKALFWKGALNPYRHVHHPGTRANPFMSDAINNSLDAIQGFFEKAVQNIVDIMAGK